MKIYKFSKEIKCEDASEVFARVGGDFRAKGSSERAFLLESKDVSHIYGRLSLIGIDPVLEIRGKDDNFEIQGLNKRSLEYFAAIKSDLMKFCGDCKFDKGGNFVSGTVKKSNSDLEEGQRTKRKNIAQIIRLFLGKFKQDKKELMGLYGAFSYDFIRLFEDIPSLLPDNNIYDFRLSLYDTFIFFDHLKDKAEIIVYRNNLVEAKRVAKKLEKQIKGRGEVLKFRIKNDKFNLNKDEYKNLVRYARGLAKKGELFEVVYSNTLKAKFEGDPFALYQKYREVNPSPYLFYFNFGDEQLVGASPEMMVRCENGIVHLRPISGTAKRGRDPIEDHENMLNLLSSEKERAELDMLIDLGRNDLARICESGIEISDYRFVEKYSKVMHTVAHVSGKLRKQFTALDALIACMNAGTLTGAPKVAAMIEIEKKETSRRGYYGGTIGYFTLSGDMDTGIIIRTAHIKNKQLSFRVGATLLYDSDPEAEYQETLNKARAFLTTFEA